MANTISVYAKNYVNNQMETLSMLNGSVFTKDLLKPLLSHKGKAVDYDKVTFGGSFGSYNRATGYTNNDITVTRETNTLSQDKGNSLYIDAEDATEAQVEGSTVRLFNQYVLQIATPAIDTYVLSKIGAYSSATEAVHASLSASNIIGFILADTKKIKNARVKVEECILYIGCSAMAYLDEASLGKGYITLGSWNGQLDPNVRTFKGMKIVEVPDDELPTNVQWIICHPLAADFFMVGQDVTFWEAVPGFGSRKKQVDIGFYYDCFVRPNGEAGIVVSVSQTRASA